jgi:hypothetical protein
MFEMKNAGGIKEEITKNEYAEMPESVRVLYKFQGEFRGTYILSPEKGIDLTKSMKAARDWARSKGIGEPIVTHNPWKKENFNLSEQGQIVRYNRAMAERMQREASA